MSSIPTLTVTPASAANAYARVQSGDGSDAATGGQSQDFGGVLTRALQGVADAGHQADTESMRAIAGQGSLTDLTTAVSRAELALQTALAVRDRVVQAYQDVSRMAI